MDPKSMIQIMHGRSCATKSSLWALVGSKKNLGFGQL
jgi:hypothetical protein